MSEYEIEELHMAFQSKAKRELKELGRMLTSTTIDDHKRLNSIIDRISDLQDVEIAFRELKKSE